MKTEMPLNNLLQRIKTMFDSITREETLSFTECGIVTQERIHQQIECAIKYTHLLMKLYRKQQYSKMSVLGCLHFDNEMYEYIGKMKNDVIERTDVSNFKKERINEFFTND